MKTRLCLWLLLLIPGLGFADSSLDSWLRNEAAPSLGSFIDQQPRFIGESVEIFAMRDGEILQVSDGLTDKIRRELRSYLMADTGIRLPLSQAVSCDIPKPTANIVLGIDIEMNEPGRYRVTLAMLDLGDGIWINGSSRVWRGRLSSGERQLLAADTRGIDARRTKGVEPSCTQGESVQVIATVPRVNSQPAVPVPLLTDIELPGRKNYCRGEGRHCVDVRYECWMTHLPSSSTRSRAGWCRSVAMPCLNRAAVAGRWV